MLSVPESSVRKVWPKPYPTVLVRLSEDTGLIPRLGTRHSKSGLVTVIVGLGIVRPYNNREAPAELLATSRHICSRKVVAC
jgi:hypothetical protein